MKLVHFVVQQHEYPEWVPACMYRDMKLRLLPLLVLATSAGNRVYTILRQLALIQVVTCQENATSIFEQLWNIWGTFIFYAGSTVFFIVFVVMQRLEKRR